MKKIAMKLKFIKFIATGFASGLSPKAPGTAGSLAYLFLHFLFFLLFPNLLYLKFEFILAFSVCLSAFIFTKLALINSVFSSNKDPQQIVIDEWAGLSIALIGAPFNAYGFVSSFLLFRFFDITKPGPVKKFDDMPGTKGIVLDDIVAGILALLCRIAIDFIVLKLST